MTKTSTSPPGAEVEESQSEQLFQALERFIEHMETSTGGEGDCVDGQ